MEIGCLAPITDIWSSRDYLQEIDIIDRPLSGRDKNAMIKINDEKIL